MKEEQKKQKSERWQEISGDEQTRSVAGRKTRQIESCSMVKTTTVVDVLRQNAAATANFGTFIALGLGSYERCEAGIVETLDRVQLSWKAFERRDETRKLVVEIFNMENTRKVKTGEIDLAKVCFGDDDRLTALSRWFFVFVLKTSCIDLSEKKAKQVLDQWRAWCIHNEIPVERFAKWQDDLRAASLVALSVSSNEAKSVFAYAECGEASQFSYAAEMAGKGLFAGGFIASAGSSILTYMGFTQTGIAAGSYAASIQTANTVAGGLFATLQSAGATGLIATVGTAGLVVAGAGGAAWFISKKFSSTSSVNVLEELEDDKPK